MKKNAKALIERLYKEKDRYSKHLAGAVNSLSDEIYTKRERFIFELIQNAADAPNPEKKVTIKIVFLDQYVVFLHNGKTFSREEVKSLAGVNASTKCQESKIGYKGIGFKSVFAFSDKVYIHTGDFQFRFDADHNFKVDHDIAWQMIPIWTPEENFPKVLREIKDCFNYPVCIAIQTSDIPSLENEIFNLFKNPEVLLFTDHIHRVELNGTKSKCIITKETKKNRCSLYINDHFAATYLVEHISVPVPKEVRKQINSDNKSLPPKIKDTDHSIITYAALLDENNRIQRMETAVVFAWLPTGISMGLPFIINGDFITTASRENFKTDHYWNLFLFFNVAYNTFRFLSKLSATPHFKRISQIIPKKYAASETMSDPLKEKYNAGLDEGVLKIPFIRGNNKFENRLFTVGEILIDKTQLTLTFDCAEAVIATFDDDLSLIHPDIEQPCRIKALGAKCFGQNDLVRFLKTQFIQNFLTLNNSCAFFDFLMGIKGFFLELKTIDFIFNENGDLESPERLFYSEDKISIPSIDMKDRLIHHRIFKQVKNISGMIEWLESTGVSRLTEKGKLDLIVYPLLKNHGVDEENTFEICDILVQLNNKGLLAEPDCLKLINLKLLTQSGELLEARRCYLADAYQPDFELEGMLSPETSVKNFVSERYIHGDNFAPFRDLFLKIKVKQDIEIQRIKNRVKRPNIPSRYKKYLEFVDKGGFYDSIYANYRGQHGIENFLTIFFLKYLDDYEYANLFWKRILPQWKIKKLDEPSKYWVYNGRSNAEIPSCFEYYVKLHKSLPCTDRNCHQPSKVYSSSLKKIVNGIFPTVIDFPDHQKEMERFFNVRQELSLEDCFKLLTHISRNSDGSDPSKKLFKIYKTITVHLKKGQMESRTVSETIREWIEDGGKLMATDNQFYCSNELFYFDCPGIKPGRSKYLIKIEDGISNRDSRRLLKVLKVKLITQDKLVLSFQENSVDSLLKNRLLDRLPFFAIVLAGKTEKSFEKIIEKYEKMFKEIRFTAYDKKPVLSYEYRGKEIVRLRPLSYFASLEKQVYHVGTDCDQRNLFSLIETVKDIFNNEITDSMVVGQLLQWPAKEILNWLKADHYVIPELCFEHSHDQHIKNKSQDYLDEQKAFEKPFEFSPALAVEKQSNVQIFQNDYSPQRKPSETKVFAAYISDQLFKSDSEWAGYIYHFTHYENALSIVKKQTIYPRNKSIFQDSAGAQIIDTTCEVIKELTRFYFRPLTPTQWHNESLGRRRYDIYALCPVTVFFRFAIRDVLDKYRGKCAVSNGNLAAKYSFYGNSKSFAETLNYENMYKKFGEIPIEDFKRASQQEFIIDGPFDFKDIGFEMICKSKQDRQLIQNSLNPLPKNCKGIHVDTNYFYNDLPVINVSCSDKQLEIGIDHYQEGMEGELEVKISDRLLFDRVFSSAGSIKDISIKNGKTMITAKQNISIEFDSIPPFEIMFTEKNNSWKIYTNAC